MKKIKQFDMKFVCESGNYKLEGCKNIPTLEQSLEALGCGKFEKIIIDNVVFEL